MSGTLPEVLSNRYFVMRHGHSMANAAGIVISDPANGVTNYGLSDAGREQVAHSITRTDSLTAETRVFCSDFLRARETANMVCAALGSGCELCADERLRERFFGRYEGGDAAIYPEIWRLDREDPSHETGGVESALSVSHRVSALVNELEHEASGTVYLLVAHGDPLQILQAVFHGLDVGRHREIEHLETAEIRELHRIGPDTSDTTLQRRTTVAAR